MELILFSLFTICVVSLLNYEKGVTIKQLTDVMRSSTFLVEWKLRIHI